MRYSALALGAVVLGACSDEPTATAPAFGGGPQLDVGDVYTVTNTNDDGLGSLRWAFGYITGGEIIRFDPSLAGRTIVLQSPLATDEHVIIEGPAGAGITISGGGTTRVFEFRHSSLDTSVLRNLTITGGRAPQFAPGGAILGNTSLRLEHTTVAGNAADAMAAIYMGNLTLINSTVSGNVSMHGYPALYANRLTLVNSTITDHTTGGAAFNMLTTQNSIIANNGVGVENQRNCSAATIVHEGMNISDDDSCGDPNDIIIADPMLDVLADNGGPGRTHALLVGSPAINAGASCTVQVDQRYIDREGACDLGAFEFIDPTVIDISIDRNATVSKATGTAVVTGSMQCSRAETFDIVVEFEQAVKTGRVYTDMAAKASIPVTCDTTAQPWAIALQPAGGAFTKTNAQVSARTENVPGWATPDSAARAVKVFWAK